MATSRRRERELARRRYERRRLREQQARARRRRRNTIVGASVGAAAVIAAVVLLAIHLSGGSSKSPTALDSGTPTPTPSATPPPPATAAKKCAPISPNPPDPSVPKLPDWTKPVPDKLVTRTIQPGKGPVVKEGDTVQVDYVGIGCSTGAVFDATYLHPDQPLTVTVGAGQVIPGFDDGLAGLHLGETSEFIIPAKLGYGADGAGATIKPNAPLIFVVTPFKAPTAPPSPAPS